MSEFKKRCLGLLEEMSRRGGEILVTKRGRPLARVTPARGPSSPLRGALRGKIEVRGEIVATDWSDEFDATR